MDILYDGLRIFAVILAFIVMTKILMHLADWIGKQLGIKAFVAALLQTIKKKL